MTCFTFGRGVTSAIFHIEGRFCLLYDAFRRLWSGWTRLSAYSSNTLAPSWKGRTGQELYAYSGESSYCALFGLTHLETPDSLPGASVRPPCEQSLLLSFSLLRRRKVGSARIPSTLWSRRSPNFWTSQSCFLSSNRFFQCEDKNPEKHTLAGRTSPLSPYKGIQSLITRLNSQRLPVTQHRLHSKVILIPLVINYYTLSRDANLGCLWKNKNRWNP